MTKIRKPKEGINPPPLNTKVAKYYFAKQSGKTQDEAKVLAGYSPHSNAEVINRTEGYQQLQKYYKDALTDRISVGEIADEHVKVIRQDNELGPKLMAIKMATDKIEPDGPKEDDDDKLVVILE